MDWTATLKALAPTVASALLGPLGGIAVAAIGKALDISDATQNSISDALTLGSMTPEQISKLKILEAQYRAEEEERGFRYAELEFKDRDSARVNNVAGGTQRPLFWLSLLLLALTLGTEVVVLFRGYPSELSEIIVGRVLGLMDAVALMVLSYWYGTSSGSAQKTQLLAAGK